MNSSGPSRPNAAEAAVAESTKSRREILCIALPLYLRAESPSDKHRLARAASCRGEYYSCPLFGCNRRRGFLDFLELRLKATLEQPVEAIEVEIDYRGNVKRQQL